MMDTLTEMKNNLQGINSGTDEAKNEISNLEYKRAKNNQNNKKKKKSKNMKIVEGASGKTSSIPTFASWSARRRTEKEIENLLGTTLCGIRNCNLERVRPCL